jgi:hypothetical protein
MTMSHRTLALAAALLGLLSAGCSQDRYSLSIQSVCAPTDDCTFSDVCDAQYIGLFKITAGASYQLFLQVANQAPNNADLGSYRVNTNDAHVTGATIEFSGARSGTVSFPMTPNQWVPAGGSAVIGLNVGASATNGLVQAKVRLTGYYDNGREFETGDYTLNYTVVAAGSIGTCSGTDIVTCPGTGAATLIQTPSACAAP